MTSTVPPGRNLSASLPRHFVPGYDQPVPPGQTTACPSGTKAIRQSKHPWIFAKEDPTATQTEAEASLNDRQSVSKSKFFKNPMHRSGLALAGAQTTIGAWQRGEV